MQKPSIIQKMVALLLIALIIMCFLFLRINDIKKIKNNQDILTKKIEETSIKALNILYDDAKNIDTNNDIFSNEIPQSIIDKFLEVNSVLKNSNLKIEAKQITLNKLYKPMKKAKNYYIYEGTLLTHTYSKNDSIPLISEQKKVLIYVKDFDSKIKFQNIIFNETISRN